ncbi:hypothetical protein U1Q18_002870 [Sarracenia purpurea var. burkii]
MERHICKICSKRFSNGKAIGGHMRTHLAFHPIPPKPQGPQEFVDLIKESSSMPLCLGKEKDDKEGKKNNGSSRKVTGKRRRQCKSIDAILNPASKPKITGLVSVNSPIEDVALSIMMLSNGKWKDNEAKKEKGKGKGKVGENYTTIKNKSKERNDDDDDNDDADYTFYPTRARSQIQSQTVAQIEAQEANQSNTYSKVRRSYRRLENHRARHEEIETQLFACESCSKVFDSRQALGGHKKIHASNLQKFPKLKCNLIDLNQPPPEEEDDESN